jgi:dihydrofolate synthase/folylpolyglutamate synthase
MLLNYSETLAYLYANLPMFQRVGAVAYKKDLTNTLKLCEVLGNPQHAFKSIHVAGTNGKGSSSHMLASVLQSSGYKTGLYTSPHLKEFTERIKVNGAEVSREFVVQFVSKIKPHIETIKPSFFEITVAMAFDYFAQQQVDVAVIEVGLGGRLDSTNVITPVVSLITNIGYDHKDLLGDTLELIAGEKAGIIKPQVPVVISERQPEIEHVFLNTALMCHAEIRFAQDRYTISRNETGLDILVHNIPMISGLQLPLKGLYQSKNLAGVLEVVDVLKSHGFTIPDQQVRHGLENTVVQTGLKGRWQQLGTKPLIICDTGHNVDGVREVVHQISQQNVEHLHIVWGMVKDKDPDEVLKLLPVRAKYYFCQANIPRAMEATVLCEKATRAGLTGEVIPEVNAALRAAKLAASTDDFIFIGGSTFVVAELENL